MVGPGTRLSYLTFNENNTNDGKPCPGQSRGTYSLQIEADNVTIDHDDISQQHVSAAIRTIGIGVGWNRDVSGTVIRSNTIHDFGGCLALTHGIYVAHSYGAQIYGNRFWNGPHGWAVQLYPSAMHSHVYNNVVDHVGSGFALGGEASDPSSHNVIDHNVVMNSTGLPTAGLAEGVALSAWWGGRAGVGNIFHDNLSINNPGGVFRGWGVVTNRNRVAR